MKNFFVKLFVIATIATIIYCLFGRFFQAEINTKSVKVEDPIALLDSLHASEKGYLLKIDSMKHVNTELNQHITKTNSALIAIKKENSNLKKEIDTLLSVHFSVVDTSSFYANCDSLASALIAVQEIDHTKDSLYESMSSDYLSQLSIKDSMIILQQDQSDSLRKSLSEAVVQNHQLATENATQKEIIKKNKKGKRLLGGILVAVVGLFTMHAIH